MVLSVWIDARLSTNTMNDIVKMEIKGFDTLDLLNNWRHLTMLTTTYKMISKLLVERFKPIIPKIVEPQQIRFF